MHRKSISLIVILLAIGSGNLRAQADIPPAEPWNVKSIKSPAYTAATAHEPNFTDRDLWPEEMQKAAFIKEAWPKTRVLVWAKPGENVKDGGDPKYWLEDGKPATTPFDASCDLVFPDREGGGMYYVSITDGRKYQPNAFRHLTLGRGAGIVGHFSVGGNIWIKKGARVQYLDSCVGAANTFLRNDNEDIRLVDHFFLKKLPSASNEFIGKFSSDDEWRLNSGLMILAPESQIAAGDRTDPTIDKDAALALLSGSYFERRSNCDWGDDLVVKGKFSAGLPDRPLTRDARLGLGYKSKGVFIGSTSSGGRTGGPGDYGLVVAPEGSFKIHASEDAHLIIDCSKLDPDWGQIKVQALNLNIDLEELTTKLKSLPKRTDMLLLGDVDMSHVLFDDIRKGGILMPDPSKAKQWTKVKFGANNGGTPQELLEKYKKP